jgi:hypothetical protein
MFQNDLKGLLAYSTISHLGLITLLLGLNSPLAAVAAVFHILNHATFKASLFMAAGIIDHESGTRDIRKLSGLFKLMPFTATLAMVASASMAGVPLLNGFLSKDVLRRNRVHLATAWVEIALPVSPPSPAPSAWPMRCALPSMCSSARPPPTCPTPPRAAALDARAGRAAGVHLPGGGHLPGPGGRPAARRRLPVVGGTCRNTAWRSGTAGTRR